MTDLKAALEAVLFAAGESVPVGRLSLVFAVEQDEVLQAAKELSDEYDRDEREYAFCGWITSCSSAPRRNMHSSS